MSKTKINFMVKKETKWINNRCTMVHHLKEKKWMKWMMKSNKNMTKKQTNNRALNSNKL